LNDAVAFIRDSQTQGLFTSRAITKLDIALRESRNVFAEFSAKVDKVIMLPGTPRSLTWAFNQAETAKFLAEITLLKDRLALFIAVTQ
jgi:hypothetical protein